MIGFVAGVMLQAYAALPGVDSLPRDPATDSLRRAETRFMAAWRREWMGSRRERTTYQRLASLHCHHDGSWKSGAPNIIRSKESSRSFCPVWFPVDDSLPSDERDGVDASLSDEARQRVRKARAELIQRFQAAAAGRWSNPWLAGQLVRLTVDQKDFPAALAAARSCQASRSWCLLLEGYVHHQAGRIATADSTFLRAAASMPPDERCEWTSVAPLLDHRARAAYERIDCGARDSVDANFWWLADPLYIEPGNARRAEHFARQVLVRLHAGLTMDERWDWRQKYGGDALAAMIVRYGWPSHLFWAGYYEDGGHFEWLGFRDSAINVAPEYKLPGYHSAPPWRAVLDPATLTAADWAHFAPRMGYGAVEWENDDWPVEHAVRKLGPLIELPDQTVVFRRDNDALLAMAMDVPQKFFAPGVRVPYDAAIVAARDANERWTPSRESILLDGHGTTVLVSPLSARAQVVSAELAPADGAPGLAARARRAVDPPAPLSVLPAGEIAVSDPLFFRPTEGGELPTTAQAAIARMLGSLTLTERRVGVFWETYGVKPTDSVQVSLHIESLDRPGFLRRLGSRVGIGEASGGALTMSWREPQRVARDSAAWEGDVPVLGRAVVLDVSRLRSGRYRFDLSVARAGSPASTTHREIMISR